MRRDRGRIVTKADRMFEGIRTLLVVGVLLAGSGVAGPAKAALIVYDFSGTFDGGSGDLASGTISGWFMLDTSAPVVNLGQIYYVMNIPAMVFVNGRQIGLTETEYSPHADRRLGHWNLRIWWTWMPTAVVRPVRCR